MRNLLRRRKAALEVNGREVRLDPASLIGSGGEADIYDLGHDTALKLFKRPDHPDYAQSPVAQQAVADRLDEHQTKLPALMKVRLPRRVVAPLALVTDEWGRIAGYTMPLIRQAELLLRYGDAGFRQKNVAAPVVAILSDLQGTVAALHREGVVIGDFNDLNVLVRGSEAFLIDADSAQFGPFGCSLFTARFLDPRLTDGRLLQPARPHDEGSDWYAFAVMAFQLLLLVDPYGGVYRPPRSGDRLPHDARPLRRISVFHPDVRYPRHALPLATLAPDLRDYFRAVFEKDLRGAFPLHLLAAPVRPAIAHRSVALVVRGRVTADSVAAMPLPRKAPRHWIENGNLLREGSLGPEVVGQVLAGRTWFWVGETFGFGFYRASEMTVGFVFDGRRRGIRDDVRLPRIAGQIIDADAVFTADRCWFFLSTQEEGRLRHRCTVVRRDGSVEATLDVEPVEGHWLTRIHGHAASGGFLLAATDEGVVRIEASGGTLQVTATFPDTAELVDAATTLRIAADALYAASERGIFRLRLT